LTRGPQISYPRRLRTKSCKSDLVTKRVQNRAQNALTPPRLIAERARRIWRGPGAPARIRQFGMSRAPLRVSFLIGAFLIDARAGGVSCIVATRRLDRIPLTRVGVPSERSRAALMLGATRTGAELASISDCCGRVTSFICLCRAAAQGWCRDTLERAAIVEGAFCRQAPDPNSELFWSEFGPRDPSSCVGLVLLCGIFSPGAQF
jgi:hypothetical protein